MGYKFMNYQTKTGEIKSAAIYYEPETEEEKAGYIMTSNGEIISKLTGKSISERKKQGAHVCRGD